MGNKQFFIRVILALMLSLLASAVASPLSVRRLAFCAPAAHVAGFLSGAPCMREGSDYRLLGPALDLTLVPACAAADYFCLLTGFLSLLASWRRLRLGWQMAVLPAAWILTIPINALRFLACWQADRFAQALLPPTLWGAVHMAVGVATFLTCLTGIFWVACSGLKVRGSSVETIRKEII